MKCPTLIELPPPPAGRTGWPWTEETPALPPVMPDGNAWPRVSIVMPSYNQGRFIEEAIRSVLLQGYPDYELVVVDGGSTDTSVDTIRKYEPWITHWVSEKDRGQSHAINKGIAQVTGPMFGWLNTDDYYLPGSLEKFAQMFAPAPDASGWAGATQVIDAQGAAIEVQLPRAGSMEDLGEWAHKAYIPQPSCLFSTAKVRHVGGVNEALHYTMDVALHIQLAGLGEYSTSNDVLTCFRMYEGSKTSDDDTGALVEIISTDFNLGMRRVAENLLRQRIYGAQGLAIDRLMPRQRCRLLDGVSYGEIARYLMARVMKSIRIRVKSKQRQPGKGLGTPGLTKSS